MAWVSPRTWLSGAIVTAAQLNEIRDSLKILGEDAWASYTPTWTAATTNPTMGATTMTGQYRLLNNSVDFDLTIVIGAGFSAGSGNYRFTYPPGITPLLTNPSRAMGYGSVRDSSTSISSAFTAYYFSSTAFALFNATDIVGSAAPITWATGDLISASIRGLQIV